MWIRRHPVLTAIGALLAVLVVPVAVTQLTHRGAVPSPGPRLELRDMEYQEVQFSNPEEGLQLAGMLFLPRGEGPFPTVVVIQGSGPSRRTNSWYLTFADDLQRHGIAVLLPDKRGSEGSGGDWHTASFEDLATDTLAAISYITEERPQLASAIGIMGMSQGGHIAPLVAARDHRVAFVVDVVGSSLPMYDVLHYEETHNLRQMGVLPGLSNGLAFLTTRILRDVTQRPFWSAVGDFDPLPAWREVDVPALVVYGEDDTNVPSDRSRDRLLGLGKPNIRVVVFPGSGHGLRPPDGVAGTAVRADALTLIHDFILSAATRS
jgi:dipeptidyl aminopeptidase/acylaminoacyl peptidase